LRRLTVIPAPPVAGRSAGCFRFHTLALPVLLALGIAGMAHVATAAPASTSALASLAWMSGSWSGTQGGTSTEEHWTSPEGGLMLGMNRTRNGGRAVMFEFLRIAVRNDSLFYVALPRGRGETWFPAKERTDRRIVFENLEHDFPQRILYWQEKPGELHARTEGTIDGKLESEEWVWRKARIGR